MKQDGATLVQPEHFFDRRHTIQKIQRIKHPHANHGGLKVPVREVRIVGLQPIKCRIKSKLQDKRTRNLPCWPTESRSAFAEPTTPGVLGSKKQPPSKSGTSRYKPDSHNAFCDGCKAQIVGVRYRCSMCTDYDLCGSCMDKTPRAHTKEHLFLRIDKPRGPARPFGRPGVKFSSYPALQNRSKIKHDSINCSGCCTQNIVGIRYQCIECVNVNLCEACEMKGVHNVLHTRLKIAKPIDCPPKLTDVAKPLASLGHCNPDQTAKCNTQTARCNAAKPSGPSKTAPS